MTTLEMHDFDMNSNEIRTFLKPKYCLYILNIVTFQYTISFTSFTGKAAIFYDFQPVGYLPVSYKFLTLENEEMNPWP